MGGALLDVQLISSAYAMKHDRTVYGIVRLLGDLGGVMEILIVAFACIVAPVN